MSEEKRPMGRPPAEDPTQGLHLMLRPGYRQRLKILAGRMDLSMGRAVEKLVEIAEPMLPIAGAVAGKVIPDLMPRAETPGGKDADQGSE